MTKVPPKKKVAEPKPVDTDLMDRINKASAELQEILAEIKELAETANALESQVKEARLKRHELRKRAESLTTALRHDQIQVAIQTATQAAEKAKDEAEATLSRLKEKEKRRDGKSNGET
jgi:predicted  nucleic acid-binding Zn-ribbon protein